MEVADFYNDVHVEIYEDGKARISYADEDEEYDLTTKEGQEAFKGRLFSIGIDKEGRSSKELVDRIKELFNNINKKLTPQTLHYEGDGIRIEPLMSDGYLIKPGKFFLNLGNGNFFIGELIIVVSRIIVQEGENEREEIDLVPYLIIARYEDYELVEWKRVPLYTHRRVKYVPVNLSDGMEVMVDLTTLPTTLIPTIMQMETAIRFLNGETVTLAKFRQLYYKIRGIICQYIDFPEYDDAIYDALTCRVMASYFLAIAPLFPIQFMAPDDLVKRMLC